MNRILLTRSHLPHRLGLSLSPTLVLILARAAVGGLATDVHRDPDTPRHADGRPNAGPGIPRLPAGHHRRLALDLAVNAWREEL